MTPRAWSPPLEFEEYRLVRILGRGAMGTVWLAQDTALDRPVALKFVDAVDLDDLARERFVVEGRALARIHHPNVVAVYRIGEVDRHPYLVSEYLRGQSLDKLSRPVPPAEGLQLALGLARGLAVAHRGGVLHRDVKPANAFLDEAGGVKLIDFGLAKILVSGAPEPDALASTLGRGHAMGVDSAPTASPVETEPGSLLGTPLYMAPELWQGDMATRASDVYSLGALLYELLGGRPPHVEATLIALAQACCERDVPPLKGLCPAVPNRLASIVDRCLRRLPEERFPTAEAVRDALEGCVPRPRGASIPPGNPYRGLLAFESKHRALFFGRESEAAAVVERLRGGPLAIIAGVSGVGKSSLAKASILPLIEDGAFSNERARWRSARLVPGRQPVLALAAALSPLLEADEADLVQLMRSDPPAVGRALRARREEGTVLLIDQLEELFTLADEVSRHEFAWVIQGMLRLASGVRVVCTLRSDLLGGFSDLPELRDDVVRALYLLGPLTAEGLRAAVSGPARALGVGFESEADVDSLVSGMAGEPGKLPLLEFALSELWETRDTARNLIAVGAIQAMGGVEGALAKHADGVLSALTPDLLIEARRILLQMTTAEGLRRPCTEHELKGASTDVTRRTLEALVAGRLIVTGWGPEGGYYEIAHEALLERWPALRRWRAEGVEEMRFRERIHEAARIWVAERRHADLLWQGEQVAALARWSSKHDLFGEDRDFAQATRAQHARRRRIRRGLIAGALALLGGVAATASLALLVVFDVFTSGSKDRALRAAGLAGDIVLQRMQEANRDATRLARSPQLLAILQGRDRTQRIDIFLTEQSRLVTSGIVEIVGRQGECIAAAMVGREQPPPSDQRACGTFDKTRSAANLLTGAIFGAPSLGLEQVGASPLLSIRSAVPVLDDALRPEAAVVVTVVLDDALVDSVKARLGVEVGVFRRAGGDRVVAQASTIAVNGRRMLEISPSAPIAAAVLSGAAPVGVAEMSVGQAPYLFGFAPLASGSAPIGLLAVGIERGAELRARSNAQRLLLAGLAIPIAVVLGSFFVMLLLGRSRKPSG